MTSAAAAALAVSVEQAECSAEPAEESEVHKAADTSNVAVARRLASVPSPPPLPPPPPPPPPPPTPLLGGRLIAFAAVAAAARPPPPPPPPPPLLGGQRSVPARQHEVAVQRLPVKLMSLSHAPAIITSSMVRAQAPCFGSYSGIDMVLPINWRLGVANTSLR